LGTYTKGYIGVVGSLYSVTYVAFFRNLNQGQRNSPTGAALIEAFVRCGATDVATFQGNGTVTFRADHAPKCAEGTAEILRSESPWHDVVFVRRLEWATGLVKELGLAPAIDPRFSEVSLFNETSSVAGLLPIAGRRCWVTHGGSGYAVTVNERLDESNATPTLERATGEPVTSRGLLTLQRLVRRFDRDRDGRAVV
jgi:uncharacterized protein (DUF1697 family)